MGYFECGVTAGLKIVHWYKESESGDLSRVTSNGFEILPMRQYSRVLVFIFAFLLVHISGCRFASKDLLYDYNNLINPDDCEPFDKTVH